MTPSARAAAATAAINQARRDALRVERAEVLAMLREWGAMKPVQISRELGHSNTFMMKGHLHQLQRDGLVRRGEDGLWRAS